jgi:hypothetical protein
MLDHRRVVGKKGCSVMSDLDTAAFPVHYPLLARQGPSAMMPDDYADDNEPTFPFPFTLMPRRLFEWFVHWFGGHYVSEDG